MFLQYSEDNTVLVPKKKTKNQSNKTEMPPPFPHLLGEIVNYNESVTAGAAPALVHSDFYCAKVPRDAQNAGNLRLPPLVC